jgi:hypothetical protein
MITSAQSEAKRAPSNLHAAVVGSFDLRVANNQEGAGGDLQSPLSIVDPIRYCSISILFSSVQSKLGGF